MEDDLKNSETKSDEEPKPKRKKEANHSLESISFISFTCFGCLYNFFSLMHKSFVQAPLSREEIAALLVNNQEEEISDNKSEENKLRIKMRNFPKTRTSHF